MRVPSCLYKTALMPFFAISFLATAAPTLAAAVNTRDLPQQVTFSEHIAPVFFDHCISCHRPYDVAPMSLLSYETARPWAKSIARTVVARDMPPWDADRRYGDFENDISLADDEIALIERWVAQGAVEGDRASLPATPELPAAGSWRMGREPDYMIELAPVEVPADGPDLFFTQIFGSNVPEGKWIQAIELLPGNTDVLHHVVIYLGPFGIGEEETQYSNAGIQKTIYLNEAARRPIGMVETPRIGGVWVAGSPPTKFRTGTGQPVAANELFSFNMHYHPSGNSGTDASKLGVYYGEGEITKEITTAFAVDTGIHIPAGDADYRADAVYLFGQDSQILSLLPHMHNRGKSMKYVLERPDGSEEVLLDVPQYDYNWQNIYRFREPVDAPAGSLVKVDASWDNSADNPANPDSTVDVRWGDGTNHEMLVGFIDYIDAKGKKTRPVPSTPQVERLLARHEPREGYLVGVEGMGFGGKWGLVVPELEGEPGELYMLVGKLMFSTSISDIIRTQNEIILNGSIITGAGGARLPMSFVVAKSEEGSTLSGEVFFGRELSLDTLAEVRGTGQGLAGESLASTLARRNTSSGGR